MKLEDNLSDLGRISNMLGLGPVAADMVTSLCGEFLGSGTFRSVFTYNLDHKYVIKVEPLNTGCNLVEYMMWNEIQGLCGELEYVKHWFAPVKWISPNGRLLVMERTFQKENKERPVEIPKMMWDIKPGNFGWIGNKFVCHDYGQFYNFIHYKRGMQKINWSQFF